MVNITVQYRDGGKDVFLDVASHCVDNGMLIIEDTKNRFVHIIINVITFFKVEEV